jgi:hypothetical protein
MTERRAAVIQSLLNLLIDCDGDPAAEEILHLRLETRVHPKPTFLELQDAAEYIERQGWSRGIRGGLHQTRRWAITEKGRLAEL